MARPKRELRLKTEEQEVLERWLADENLRRRWRYVAALFLLVQRAETTRC